MDEIKRVSPHRPDRFHCIPVTSIGRHTFNVNHCLPINKSISVYWYESMSFLRESQLSSNNLIFIKTGKSRYLRSNKINAEKDLSGLGDFYV